jgi:hypothetical protein
VPHAFLYYGRGGVLYKADIEKKSALEFSRLESLDLEAFLVEGMMEIIPFE